MTSQWFNLPNRVTLARLGASIVLFVVLSYLPVTTNAHDVRSYGVAGLVLFVLVSASDWLDGYLARKYGQVTKVGRILDPFVDKVAVCGTYVMLLRIWQLQDILQSWMVVVIVAREFFVNDSRGFFESQGVSFAAELPGKIKMLLQSFSVSFLLFQLATGADLRTLNVWLVWAAVAATVLSGVFYLRKGMILLKSAEA